MQFANMFGGRLNKKLITLQMIERESCVRKFTRLMIGVHSFHFNDDFLHTSLIDDLEWLI